MEIKQISAFSIILVILFQLCGTSHGKEYCPTSTNSTDDEPLPIIPNRNTTRCGEVLLCPSGGIFYKPFEMVLANERCIWTIYAAGATAYEITIPYYGYIRRSNNEDDHGLIISEFGGRRKPTHFIPSNTTTLTITNTSVLMVTFFSGARATNQSGFILEFKALFNSSFGIPASSTSEHYLLGADQYMQTYPTQTMYYRVNELSTFVFTPRDNIYREGKENMIASSKMGLESTYDFLKVYSFNTTCVGANKWEFIGRMWGRGVGSTERAHLIKTSEPILIVFESVSGYYRSYPGFGFTYFTGE